MGSAAAAEVEVEVESLGLEPAERSSAAILMEPHMMFLGVDLVVVAVLLVVEAVDVDEGVVEEAEAKSAGLEYMLFVDRPLW